MRISASYNMEFYKYNKKENRPERIEKAEKEYQKIIERYAMFYKRNLITGEEMLEMLERKAKEINKKYKCYYVKNAVILSIH